MFIYNTFHFQSEQSSIVFIYNTFHFQSEQFGGGAEATEVGGETEAISTEVGLLRFLNTTNIALKDSFKTQFCHTQSINTQRFEEEDLNGIEKVGVDDMNKIMIEGGTEFSLNLSTFVDENYLSWGGDCDFNSQLLNFSGEDKGKIECL